VSAALAPVITELSLRENRTGKIRTVILDLGNVLVFHDNARLAQNLAQAVGVSVSLVEGWARRNNDAINLGRLDGAGIHRSFVQEVGQVSLEGFAALWSSHFTIHGAVLPIVEALSSRVKLALLSNTNALHVEFLRPRLPVLERFDALLFSNEVGLAKPDPAFFREALRRTGIGPEEAIFFDDLREYTQAAESVGIRAYLFTTADSFRANLSECGLCPTVNVTP